MDVRVLAELLDTVDQVGVAVKDAIAKLESAGAVEASAKCFARFTAHFYHELVAQNVPEPVIVAVIAKSLDRIGQGK